MPSSQAASQDDDRLDLRASEERLRLATEAAKIGAYDLDLITGKTFCSVTLEEICGFLPGSSEGNPETFAALVHLDDRAFVREAVDTGLQGGLQPDLEFRIITPAGELKWLAGKARVLRDEDGRPIRWVGVAYDITDRKRVEKRLAAQYAVTSVLAGSATLAAAAPTILRTICESLDWDTGALWILDPASDSLRCLDMWQGPGVVGPAFAEFTREMRFRRGAGLPGEVWRTGESVWVPDLALDPLSKRGSAEGARDLHAAFGFPLRVGSEFIGVMDFFSREIRLPEADVLRMFASIGSQIGQVVERLRTEEALRLSFLAEKQLRERADRARERTASLQNLTAALSAVLTAGQAANVIISHAIPVMGAKAGVVYLLSPDGSEFVHTAGYADSVARRFPSVPADSPMPIAESVRKREVVIVSTLSERYANDPKVEELRKQGTQTLVAIPMFWKERAIGAIGLAVGDERTFDADDRALMLTLGRQCAEALERARLYDVEEAAREAIASSVRALQASESKFRRLVESNVIGVIFGESDVITGANQCFLDTVGYRTEDVASSRLNWKTMTPPEFRPLDERAMEETRQRSAFAPYEKELLRKDGGRVPVLVGGASLQSDLNAPWVGFVLDLTERRRIEEALRQSEARFRAIFDQAPLGIAEADLTGRLVLVNQKYCEITGYQREDLLGKPFQMQTHPDDMDANLNLWRRALAGQSSGYGLEKRYLRPDGSDVWAHVAVSVVRNQEGEPMYTLGIVQEITERKRMQEGLLRAQKLESLGVLAGGIAHDFNNLLTGILGNSMLAWERTPNGDVRSMLEDVVRAAEHASSLTQQMLAYAGKGRFVVKPVDLSRLVREVETLLKAAIPKHVPLRIELAAGLPPVEADPSQIQQLIMNLGINAAEAIENQTNGRVRIATALERLDTVYIQRQLSGADIGPGLYTALRVEDNGCGMDAETKSKIFDPFFTTKFMGRGLGLAAVYGIVRSHGGAIQVVSKPGYGTTFAVFLPVAGEDEGASIRRPDGQEAGATQTILIVDEERVVRQAASKTLEQYGYQTMLAANGDEAVEIFRQNADGISLVLLDLTMRAFGGDKVFGLLKSIRVDIPVVVTSGYHERDLAKLFPGPNVTFLQKPYTAPQLADKVKTSLRA